MPASIRPQEHRISQNRALLRLGCGDALLAILGLAPDEQSTSKISPSNFTAKVQTCMLSKYGSVKLF